MSGESGELADNIGEAAIGHTLELIRHRELEGAAAHRDRDYQPLRQWHCDQLTGAGTQSHPRPGYSVALTQFEGLITNKTGII